MCNWSCHVRIISSSRTGKNVICLKLKKCIEYEFYFSSQIIDITVFLFQERCFQNNDISNQMNDKSTKGLLSKLGMWVLPDRRLCFAGRYIKGVILPDNPAAQKRAIKALVVWYLPCLEFQAYKSTYQINNNCFFKRENELLKVYARLSTLKSHHMQERFKRFLTN